MVPYKVLQFTRDQFFSILKEKSYDGIIDPSQKPQAEYLFSYLQQLAATTFVVEEQYIDRDFLEDYAAYYVRCFANYKPSCVRVHFFNRGFDEPQFRQILAGGYAASESPTHHELTCSYLGFIVIKPLPHTIIGRTCLATYAAGPKKREFPCNYVIKPSLFGLELSIKSLPFQEQDTEVAACATSALWSALNATSRLFQHSTPSPVEITRAATKKLNGEQRALPNPGLLPSQMVDAIESTGLECEKIGFKSPDILKCASYAYLRYGIPSILIGRMYRRLSDGTTEELGGHAITITGYSINEDANNTAARSDLPVIAERVDRLYAHDDNIGPFTRILFSGSEIQEHIMGANEEVLEIHYFTEGHALLPIYHKLRVPYELAIRNLRQIDTLIEFLRQNKQLGERQRLEWDVYLTDVNIMKKDVFNSAGITAEERLRVVEGFFPKYMWIATAYSQSDKVISLLLDATDLKQGTLFVGAVIFDHKVAQVLKIHCDSIIASGAELLPFSVTLLKWFKALP